MVAQLQTTDPSVFQTLQKSIYEFMNNRKWTTDHFKATERIDCNLLLNVTQELGDNNFGAQLTVTSSRPIFNSSYNSTVINWLDKDVQFNYQQYQTLDYNENGGNSNLVDVLVYYAYLFIGLDYDTFSPSAGTPYFKDAQDIVNRSQSLTQPGWKSFESTRNRYWLIDNLLNSRMSSMRDVLYQYHRTGLDHMYDNSDDSRKVITACLNTLSKFADQNPNTMVMQVFFNSKSDELVGIYSKALPGEKSEVLQILSKLDPSDATKYQQIMKEN